MTIAPNQDFVLATVPRGEPEQPRASSLANLGFMVVALVLVLALPREIPEHAGRWCDAHAGDLPVKLCGCSHG